MKETADMLIWKKEFEKMKTEDHLSKLKELGLDEEDLEEFKGMEAGEVSVEEELLGAGPALAEDKSAGSKKKPKK